MNTPINHLTYREAEVLVQVSLIASRLDSLMACLLQAASQAAVSS